MATLFLSPLVMGQVVLVPTLSVTGTLTDRREGQGGPTKSDLVVQISPGLSASSRSGVLQGTLSYSANGVLSARDSTRNKVYHSLSSGTGLTLGDSQRGVNVSASASRQAISAFGTQGSDPTLDNANQAQVFSYSVSPYLSGRLLGEVDYRASLSYGSSITDASGFGNSQSLSGSLGLSGRIDRIGWGLNVSRVVADTGSQSRTSNDRFGGSLSYSPDVELQLQLRTGGELDDLRSGQSQRTLTWGAGLTWTPSPRTSLRLDTDRRFFGRSHTVSLSHRMARTILTASDSRSLSLGNSTGSGTVSAYDLFFVQFESIEPDPVKREVLVRNFLAANGIDAGSTIVVGGFLASSSTVQRTQSISAAYQGLRTTMTFTAFRNWSDRIGDTGQAVGDLAGLESVRQQGLTVTLSRRLTPRSSIVVTGSQQRTPGSGTLSGNSLRSVVATWTSALGRGTNVSLGMRHSRFDSDTNPYYESALTGSIRMQF